MGQMFTEKEHLVTIDRFPWHGGIQKCDAMAKVTRNTNTVSTQPFYDISDQQETVVSFVPFTFDCQATCSLQIRSHFRLKILLSCDQYGR